MVQAKKSSVGKIKSGARDLTKIMTRYFTVNSAGLCSFFSVYSLYDGPSDLKLQRQFSLSVRCELTFRSHSH